MEILLIALGYVLGRAIVHVSATTARALWQRYAYRGEPGWISGRYPPLFGRWEEGTIVPLPVSILRRVFEGGPR